MREAVHANPGGKREKRSAPQGKSNAASAPASEKASIPRPEAKTASPAPPRREPRPAQNQKLTVSSTPPVQETYQSLLCPRCASAKTPLASRPKGLCCGLQDDQNFCKTFLCKVLLETYHTNHDRLGLWTKSFAVSYRQPKPGSKLALLSRRRRSPHGCARLVATFLPDHSRSMVRRMPFLDSLCTSV